jgi:glutamate transport system permease protein
MSRTLYDVPGPRTRRNAAVVGVVVTIALLLLAYRYVYRPLATAGQFSAAKWGSIVDPSDPNFPLLWRRFGVGLRNTLLAAVLAVAASLLLGSGLAGLRLQLRAFGQRRYRHLGAPLAPAARAATWLLNAVTRVFVETFRGLPVVIAIFFAARTLPQFGLDFGDLG